MFSKNATTHDKQIVTSVLNIIHQDNLGKYLGCLVFEGMLNINTFSELVNKIIAKLQAWKARNITKAGRVALV